MFVKAAEKKFLKALGRRIREFREKEGITQDQLGYECDLHRTSINRIEQGQFAPGTLKLYAIAKALNIHVKELFDFPYDGE